MDGEHYKFSERNFDFENELPQFRSDSWLNGKPYGRQMSKKCHFEKRHSKVIPIEISHAANKTHSTCADTHCSWKILLL